MYVVARPLAVVIEASAGMGLELVWVLFNALWIWSLHPINRGFCRRRKNLPQQGIHWPPMQCGRG
jgi:hypothetical protein